MQNAIEISKKIDKHIAAIEASNNRTTILWHSGRCATAINHLEYTISSSMGYAEHALVRKACNVERNRLSDALGISLRRACGLIGGGK